jgi:hypothetical protein
MFVAAIACLVHASAELRAQPARGADTGWAQDAPVLSSLVAFARSESDLRIGVSRYLEDRAAILRRYEVQYSPARLERLKRFYGDWQRRLSDVDFKALNHEGQIDYVLLRNRLTYDAEMLAQDERRWKEIASLVPFADRLRALQEARHGRQRVDPRAAAETLAQTADEVTRLTAALTDTARSAGTNSKPAMTPAVANRAALYVAHLKDVLADWNRFYRGYDPLFTWWAAEPYTRVERALTAYHEAIRRELVGVRPGEIEPIIGDPVFADGLRADLALEMIPYNADELIAIGWREFEWTDRQFKIVSNAMGFGDDWKKALEHVKNLAPAPGEKPWAIFEIADYSEDFVEKMDAITIAPLAKEIWRLAMQTPERQLQNPFFTGGEVTRVSYPTDAMRHDDKLMSMRGNTPHFNFATVHHELIPGHHLQAFMSNRFNPHRGELMRTPFWGEGWALYWELLLWDRNFPRGNEDKIGMLFWRMHRAARIIFSLNFQLGKWSPQQAVDFLVDRVGHERANAEAEVRRSADAAPLYQLAYLIGGLQFRALYEELVDSGKMTAREFHDRVLLGGRMPVEMVRARLTNQSLARDYTTSWRFSGDPLKK